MLPDALSSAIQYADENRIPLPPELRIRARRVGAIKAGGDLPSISAQYHDAITDALIGYFEGSGSIAAPKNMIRAAMVDAFGAAFDLGWVDGGQEMPPDEDALGWFNPRVEQELGFIDGLLESAKQLKKEKDFDYFSWITSRADGYTSSLMGVYNAAKMLAQANKMLTWNLGNTERHCSTCSQLDGKRHRAKWYTARNYIPRQAGASMECGGYNCDCRLTDDEGNEVTL